jgi:hypothetical protein
MMFGSQLVKPVFSKLAKDLSLSRDRGSHLDIECRNTVRKI